MLTGGLLALTRDNMKQLLAYSTIAQYGYIVTMFGLGGKAGVFGAMFAIIAHGLAKSALFLTAGTVTEATGARELSDIGGLRHVDAPAGDRQRAGRSLAGGDSADHGVLQGRVLLRSGRASRPADAGHRGGRRGDDLLLSRPILVGDLRWTGPGPGETRARAPHRAHCGAGGNLVDRRSLAGAVREGRLEGGTGCAAQ